MRTLARLLLVLLVVKALAEPLPGGPPGLGGALVPRRSSGATKWTLKDEWGPLASVQENPSLLSDQDFADPSTQPSEPDSDFVPPHISQDGIIIPEPVGNGDLYYYAPGEDIKKLPFSIKDIAAHPSFVTDANIAYSTKKVSRLLAIHPATGALLHSYGVDEDPLLLQMRGIPPFDLNAKKVKWNITFGEFTPASIPDTLFDLGQDPSPKDVIIGKKLKNEKENLLSMSANVDGSVILDDLKNENAWELNFNSPALAAFSVGSANAQGHQVAKIYPAANSNPDPLPSSPFKSPRKAENNVYVGIVKDSYYLLSHANTNLRGIASSSDKQVVGRIEPAAKSTTTQHPPTSIKKPAITPLPSSAHPSNQMTHPQNAFQNNRPQKTHA
ncbi:hypothetical protein BCR33DRAFT_735300 [Rhizoclosmatium globosum]|uniref:Uncharacterized protein n=1 Tax=Rhizoclosmatium globosum TaxID=329046 RepID=A0A1Y2CQ58_9FUNG|nr:hypothetical protein BCR33DRAFT_735300 [Rhizoclosmatium globosum]|eukprot:ORY49160.1 hypothetical protein BCR33DRAFT_735300 [Rhizoclosmatium globosum]